MRRNIHSIAKAIAENFVSIFDIAKTAWIFGYALKFLKNGRQKNNKWYGPAVRRLFVDIFSEFVATLFSTKRRLFSQLIDCMKKSLYNKYIIIPSFKLLIVKSVIIANFVFGCQTAVQKYVSILEHI